MTNRKLFLPPKGESERHAYHSKVEKHLTTLFSPFQQYIKSQVSATILLLICTVVALVWASLPYMSSSYTALIKTPVGLHIGGFSLEKSLQFWVNDVLLTLFFFLVGLEIKRELLVGELTNIRYATFILACAVGGMCVPALMYLLINHGTEQAAGWGIPMATDTAFALGILACFRRKLPHGIFTFMAAFAIIDDIGAIIIIAFFYTHHVHLAFLMDAAGFIALLILMNFVGIRSPWPYALVGITIWSLIEFSGIHGTLTGILVAFCVPSRPVQGPKKFIKKIRYLIQKFEDEKTGDVCVLESKLHQDVLESLEHQIYKSSPPLSRWESKLDLPIGLIILPIFAFINAGIPLNFNLIAQVFTNYAAMGIGLGLLVGKPLGVLLFGYLSHRWNIADLPTGVGLKEFLAAAVLTGIGFTMSIFVANQGFEDAPETLLIAKAAILLSSLVAGIVGYLILRTPHSRT